METDISCPVCGWKSNGTLPRQMPYPDVRPDGPKPKQILFCQDCGLGMSYPRLDVAFLKNYNEKFWESPDVEYLLPQKSPALYALTSERWNYAKKFLLENSTSQNISILDVGAGFGFFGMVVTKNSHFHLKQYSVIEKDRILSQSLRKTWAKYFPFVKFEAADCFENIEGQFDLVVISHVLEHLYDPEELIRQAKEKLKPKGMLFIEVPNQDYLFKKNIFPHLIFFNVQSLETLLSRQGLQVMSLNGYGRSYDKTPIHYRYERRLRHFASFLSKLRHIIPSERMKPFFVWYFGANRINSKGTWLRAVARKD